MFGKRLRELRKKKKMTMKEFGEVFNLAESTISGYETGARKPDIDQVKKFADYFDVSMDDITGNLDISDYRNAGISEDDYSKLSPYHQEVMDFFLTREELFFKEQPEDLKDALEQFEVFYEVWKKHQQQNKSK